MAVDIQTTIARIAGDKKSGASELLGLALSLLGEALRSGLPLEPIARSLIQAQPSMAPMWNACGHALASRHDPAAFERYVQQVNRAPRSLTRQAVPLLAGDGAPGRPLAIVTLSYSGTVTNVLRSLASTGPLDVACAEGRPALEGRRLARELASHGIAVRCFTDAALAHGLENADAVVAGADAVTPGWFLNKSGTRMLAAAAAAQGIPVYVLATRDKFLSAAIGARLEIRDEPAREVWPRAPAGVTVRNPYFETIPLDLVTAVVTEMGILGAALVPDACPSTHDALLLNL